MAAQLSMWLGCLEVPRTVKSVEYPYRLPGHPASYSVGTGHAACFHWCWSGWHMKLTTHIPLVQGLRMRGVSSLHGVHRDNFIRSNQNEENLLENLFLLQKWSVDPVLKFNFNSPLLPLPLSVGISFSTVPCLTSSLFLEDSHQDYYDHFQA